MGKISFYGASSVVTGSSFIFDDGNQKLLVDLGMFQEDTHNEEQNRESLPFSVQELSAVLITHAHLDHCGRLPLLAKAGYRGDIYMTPATKDIVEISLEDSARLGERREEEDGIVPLYTMDDVDKVINLIKTVEYNTPLTIGSATVVFQDAGHILGSASIAITDAQGATTIFSGDLGNTPQDIIQPTTYFTSCHYLQ